MHLARVRDREWIDPGLPTIESYQLGFPCRF